MTFLSDFAELLPDLVDVKALSGRDRYGAPTYLTLATDVKARWVRKQRQVRQADGSQVLSSSFVRLPYVAGLTSEGRVTLPDGSEPMILSVQSAPDETGEQYYMLVSFQ